MAGVSINILSNVREAVRGVDDVADAVEDVEDRLRDLTKEGDNATDRMEDDFRSVAKSADRAADELKDKFRAAYKSVRTDSDNTADDVVRNQRKMGEQSAEVGQEIRQNLGEGIANAARGDFESLADTIGDTLGGAVAGIGGIGTAALGAAGALGIGAIIAALQIAEQERKKLEERAADLADAYIEAGSNVLDAMVIASRATEFLTDPEKRKETERLANTLGITMADAARTLAGDLNGLSVANEIVERNEEERLALMQESANYINGGLSRAEQDRLNRLLDQDQAVRELNEANGLANVTFKQQQDVLFGLIQDAGEATKEVDELGNELFTLPDGTQILVEADTKQATTNVSNFKGDVDGIPEKVTTTATLRVDDSALRFYRPPTIRVNAVIGNPSLGGRGMT